MSATSRARGTRSRPNQSRHGSGGAKAFFAPTKIRYNAPDGGKIPVGSGGLVRRQRVALVAALAREPAQALHRHARRRRRAAGPNLRPHRRSADAAGRGDDRGRGRARLLVRGKFFRARGRTRPIGLSPSRWGATPAPPSPWAAEICRKRIGDDAILLVLPADHLIADSAGFWSAAARATASARAGNFALLGIAPDHAATGYGYIRRGEKTADGGSFQVSEFVEKPTRARGRGVFAKRKLFLERGRVLFCGRNLAFGPAGGRAGPGGSAGARDGRRGAFCESPERRFFRRTRRLANRFRRFRLIGR